MLKEIPFGEWAPDLAPSHSNHITIAKNLIPVANGYAPVGGYQALTDALDGGPFRGGGMFVASDGGQYLLVGRTGSLNLWDGAAWDVVASPIAPHTNFRLTQFGDTLLVVSGGPIAYYDMIAAPPTFTSLGGASPANCIDIARVRDFVMVLRDDDTVQWSAFNDYTGWTVGTSQSDYQPLLSGGSGVGIVGGEYGIVFQKNAIKRVTYVGEPNGVDIIFQFDDISQEVGCMTQGSIASVGRLIFFLSDRGFMMCDGESVVPIADEKFNRWFFDSFTRSDIIDGMTSAIDPQRSIVYWAIPGYTGGFLLAYNWVLKRATTIELAPFYGVMSGFTAAAALEDLDALYPGGLDSISITLDDPSLNGGDPQLIVFAYGPQPGTLSGDNLEATIRQRNIELTPGRRSRLRNLRPVTDATSASAVVDARMRAGDGESLVSAASMTGTGKLPVRANGRYVDMTLTIPAGEEWSYIQGCEYEFEPGDAR